MDRWRPFLQLVLARLREFYREPEAIFWVYGFPLLLAIGLGITTTDLTFGRGGWAPGNFTPGGGAFVDPPAVQQLSVRKESLLG